MIRFLWVAIFLSFSLLSSAKLVEKVVAYIDEEMISLSDLNRFHKQIQRGLVPPSLLLKQVSRKKLLNQKKARLHFLLNQKMLVKIANEKNIKISPQNQKRLFKSMQASWSLREFNKKIKRAGFSLTQFNQHIEMALKIDRLLSQEVASKIIISDNDINAYHFNKYKKNIFRYFEYEFDSVFFPNTKKGQKELNEFVTLLSSHSFSQAAQQRRVKVNTSHLKFSEVSAAMYKVLKNLSVSQTSQPIPIGNQLYVIHLSWKTPYLRPYEQKKKQKIQKRLFERELKKEINQWIKEQKTNFSIKIHSP